MTLHDIKCDYSLNMLLQIELTPRQNADCKKKASKGKMSLQKWAKKAIGEALVEGDCKFTLDLSDATLQDLDYFMKFAERECLTVQEWMAGRLLETVGRIKAENKQVRMNNAHTRKQK